jgi:hypothetical protein
MKGIRPGELGSVADTPPTRKLLYTRLQTLRDRVETLRDNSSDARLKERCEAEVSSLDYLRGLIAKANARTLRALLAMVDTKTNHVQLVEDFHIGARSPG